MHERTYKPFATSAAAEAHQAEIRAGKHNDGMTEYYCLGVTPSNRTVKLDDGREVVVTVYLSNYEYYSG